MSVVAITPISNGLTEPINLTHWVNSFGPLLAKNVVVVIKPGETKFLENCDEFVIITADYKYDLVMARKPHRSSAYVMRFVAHWIDVTIDNDCIVVQQKKV